MAATTTKSAKRKSLESTEQALKKIKVAKSADRPLPAKSALKKAEPTIQDAVKPVASQRKAKNDVAASTKAAKSAAAPAKVSKSMTKSTPALAEKEELELDDEDDEETLTADRTEALLAGFSSSEDEDEDDEEEEGIKNVPKPPISASLSKSLDSAKGDEPGIVYVGRIPHGFFEHQMQAYFSQFGDITHLRLARNKKTGASRHYAFVEFASGEVAEIVAKTMNKYLLFNHILQVKVVPKEHVKDTMWKGAGKRRKIMPRNKMEGSRLNRGTDKAGWEKRIERERTKRASDAAKLKELGYSFDMPDVKGVEAAAQQSAVDQQLLEDVQHAADEAEKDVKASALKGTSKKRSAASTTAATEGKKSKKAKSKA